MVAPSTNVETRSTPPNSEIRNSGTAQHHLENAVAIVGMSARLPHAPNLAAFWRLLVDGKDGIEVVPPERWNAEAFFSKDVDAPGKIPTMRAGLLQDVDKFDAQFFHISNREAECMDPQQRLVLEVAYEALEDAGQSLESVRGSDTGVFVGTCFSDYHKMQLSDVNKIKPYVQTGCAHSMVSNRISYFFDLRGPSLSIDTACSSSLVALHLASQSLHSGECTTAIVGGTSIHAAPDNFVAFAKLHMLSSDGMCRAFDDRGNGYVRSEGVCVLVLKKLSQALADNDPIHAVICGTGVNQDGATPGITTPGRETQAALIRQVYAKAKLDPSETQYVEAHGTGTPVGDPIEANALGEVIGSGRRHDPCIIGSVKSNIGHLEGASGLVGVIKTILAIQHGLIPGTLHFEVPNTKIDFAQLGLRVAASNMAWPARQVKSTAAPRRASVNSFGFGGTNAHVIVEEWPASARSHPHSLPATLVLNEPSIEAAMIFPISASTKKALECLVDRYVSFVSDALNTVPAQSQREFFWNLAFTLGCRRSHLAFRTSAIASNLTELLDSLKSCKARISRAANSSLGGPKIAFVCTGQGAQWYAMGRQLLELEPVFVQVMCECDAIVRRLGSWSIIEELLRDEKRSRINSSDISQPACCALQIALIELWKSWGITPSVVLGHSSGEMAAAYACGALSLEDAMQAAFYRGLYMVQDAGKGKMAAVGLSEQEAREMLKRDGYDGKVCVAAVNSPTNVTLSGDPEPVEQICAKLSAAGVFARALRINCAFHSHHMIPFSKQLHHALLDLQPLSADARVPMISSVTKGTVLDGSELDADYWVRNMCNTVCFADAVSTLVKQFAPAIVIEIGNHPVLQGPIRQCFLSLGTPDIPILGSISRDSNERKVMLGTLATLFSMGAPIAWQSVQECNRGFDALHKPSIPRCLSNLPSYPWNHEERYWCEPLHSKLHRLRPTPHELLGDKQHHILPTWRNEISVERVPYLKDHRIQGSIVFPAAGYCEMALRAAKCISKSSAATRFTLEDITFKRAMMFDDVSSTVHTQLVVKSSGDALEFTIFATEREDEEASSWQEFCTGRICIDTKPEAANSIESHEQHVKDIISKCEGGRESSRSYAWMCEQGLEYGPFFQPLRRSICGNGRFAIGELVHTVLPEKDDLRFNKLSEGSYVLHPTLLDGCFQALIGAVENLSGSYLPVHIDRLCVFDSTACGSEDMRVFVHATEVSSKQLQGQITLCNAKGEVIAHVDSLSCSSIGNKSSSDSHNDSAGLSWTDHLYNIHWKPDFDELISASTSEPALNDLLASHKFQHPANSVNSDGSAIWHQMSVNERTRVADESALHYVLKALAAVRSSNTTVDGKHSHFMQWAEQMRSLSEKQNIQPLGAESVDLSAIADPEAKLVHRMGAELENILSGQVDPLSVMFANTTIHDVYQSGPTFTYAGRIVASIAELIAHKHGHLRIAEIGAGTGGTTLSVLNAIEDRFDSYLFTDISPAFFDKARTKFTPHVEAGRMNFSVLDIERDPLPQLTETIGDGFDLIFATDVLHATTDIATTVANVHKMLAPGGMLILNELTAPPLWIQMVFGLMPGWWLYSDPAKRSAQCGGPTLSTQNWVDELTCAGFDKVVAISDCEKDPIHTVFIAKVPSVQMQPRSEDNITLISDGEHEMGLESSLARLTSAIVMRPSELLQHHNASPSSDVPSNNSVAIYLLELQQSAFSSGLSDETLNVLRAVTTRFSTVYWIIRGALDANPHQSPIVGLSRVLANESPDLHCVVIDIDPSGTDSENACMIHKIATSTMISSDKRFESEIAIRKNRVLIPRPIQLHPPQASLKQDETIARTLGDHATHDARSPPVFLEIGQPGLLDSLRFCEAPIQEQPIGADQIEIEVHATGLNFKDVMIAMGMLSDEATAGGYCASNLGIECAGTVLAVGSNGAHGLQVGDRVLAVARNSFSTRVVTLNSLVVPIPANMTMEEAVTIPATFLTAYYALFRLARVERGETVLIHAAAGGVGQAAIQLCHLIGAKVFATCGSDSKRQFLREQLGVPDEHILSSRNTSFAEDVMRLTGGHGVDVILNSLAGDMLKRSVDVLAPFGRFLEIGKRDIYANNKLDMKPFGENISFFAIDLDRLMGKHPQIAGKMFRELMTHFEECRLRPLPVHRFSFSKPVEAFRFMQQGKHIGKVVLVQDKAETVQVIPTLSRVFRSNRTYIVVGGMGGFGRAVVEWMVREGARHVVLMSRSGGGASKEEQNDFLAKLCELASGEPLTAVIERVDVADQTALRHSLDKLQNTPTLPPIGGVFQAAMVLDDGPFYANSHTPALDATRFRKVMAPKIAGAWNLHKLLSNAPLEFFVMFSSISAVIGNFGQSNYAAANCFLDALAVHRRLQGRPAVSINWGAIGDVGYVATRQDLQQSMKKRGMDLLPIGEALKVLEFAIRSELSGQQGPAQIIAAPVKWSLVNNFFPAMRGSLFAGLVHRDTVATSRSQQKGDGNSSGNNGGTVSVQQRIAAASVEERPQIMAECIQSKLAAMLALKVEEVDLHRPMTEFGIDSLMAVEIKNWIETELKSQISVLDITGGKTISSLVAKISTAAAPVSATSHSSKQVPTSDNKSMVVCHNKLLNPKIRLICVPFLGGDETTFASWPMRLKTDVDHGVEVWTVRIGQERQWDKLVDKLATDLVAVVSTEPSIPYVVYAHSLGVLVAYEALRQIAHAHPSAAMPRHVIFGACGSPSRPNAFARDDFEGTEWSERAIEHIGATQFMQAVVTLGVVPHSNLDTEVVRSGVILAKKHGHFHKSSHDRTIQLAISCTVVMGTGDRIVTLEDAQMWKQEGFITGDFRIETIGGGHMFMETNFEELHPILARHLTVA